jgi:predicted dinucleotide-binding enzyme
VLSDGSESGPGLLAARRVSFALSQEKGAQVPYHRSSHISHRMITRWVLSMIPALALGLAPSFVPAADTTPKKIGIIGTGHIGGALALLWVKADYKVLISSRHPEELKSLAQSLGPNAQVGTPHDAAVFGDIVLVSVPYGAMPQLGQDLAAELKGKVVLDTGNPYPQRDGAMAEAARTKGAGLASAEFFPGTRLVRAFNAINYRDLESLSNRKPERVAIPIAGDDAEALAVAQRLVRDAGFDPVVVGPLNSAKQFDVGTPVYTKIFTATELRAKLGLPPQRAASP